MLVLLDDEVLGMRTDIYLRTEKGLHRFAKPHVGACERKLRLARRFVRYAALCLALVDVH